MKFLNLDQKRPRVFSNPFFNFSVEVTGFLSTVSFSTVGFCGTETGFSTGASLMTGAGDTETGFSTGISLITAFCGAGASFSGGFSLTTAFC